MPPKLRPIRAFPLYHQGAPRVCLMDPSGLTEATVVVSQGAFFVISLLDGTNSIRHIQEAYGRRFGEIIFSEDVQKIIDELDKNLLLETRRFEAYKEQLEAAFKAVPVRASTCFKAPPLSRPDDLRQAIAACYRHPDGPGDGALEMPPGTVAAIMAPHIDYGRGGPCYAWAYRCLETLSEPTTFVILGINHASPEPLFALTRKAFDTPLGAVNTDDAFAGLLCERSKTDLLAGEFHHRGEHSVELQAAWLMYLFGDRVDIKIVPLLCGSLERFLYEERPPEADEGFAGVVEALKTVASTSGRRVCFLASVDLAHMGPQFGDPDVVSTQDLTTIRAADRQVLEAIESGDKERFWRLMARDKNQRNICGLSGIYTLLSVLERPSGKLLNYGQWRDDQGAGCVTFASMAFYR